MHSLKWVTLRVEVVFRQHPNIVAAQDKSKDGEHDRIRHSNARQHERPPA